MHLLNGYVYIVSRNYLSVKHFFHKNIGISIYLSAWPQEKILRYVFSEAFGEPENWVIFQAAKPVIRSSKDIPAGRRMSRGQHASPSGSLVKQSLKRYGKIVSAFDRAT